MNYKVIFPGTFDPITTGHIDIISRATKLFQEIIVGIAENKRKSPFFTLEERITLAKEALKEYDNVTVLGFNNLLMDFAKSNGAKAILRGLRVFSDFEYEFQLANMNQKLNSEIETIFLTPSQQYSFVSSSLVKEIASLQGDISVFVPKSVASLLKQKFS